MGDGMILRDAWDLIDEMANEETKEYIELIDILYEISMKVFDYRMERGWTQKQLANKLDINQSMVSKLESGVYNPTVEQLWKISKKLGWFLEINLEENKEVRTSVWDNVESSCGYESTDELVVGA